MMLARRTTHLAEASTEFRPITTSSNPMLLATSIDVDRVAG
jgi:hypothetical protein